MTKKMKRNIVRFVTLVTLIVGGIVILYSSFSFIKTGCELAAINDDIRFYNEQHHKTDEMTKKVEQLMEQRQNEFYNSSDSLVRFFSNLPGFVKILVLIAAIALSLMVLYTWIHFIIATYLWIKSFF